MAEIIRVRDLSDPALTPYTRLTEAQLRNRREQEQGMFIAESPHVILSALEAGCQPVSLLMEEKKLTTTGAECAARCGDIPIYVGPLEVLSQLTGYPLTRGILCCMRRPPLPSPEAICAGASRIAVLNGLTDPVNVGGIFRSAAALGLDAVLVSPDCCDPFHRRAVRVSMGALFRIPWTRMEVPGPDHAQTGTEVLSALGFKTVALALSDRAISLADPVLTAEPRLAILVGNEANGLPEQIVNACDYVVKIPMAHGMDSLNAGAAAAVAFWQLGPMSGRI